MDWSSGDGTPQSRRAWAFRATLLDSHSSCKTLAKDYLLRLRLHARVRRLARMDGLCEQRHYLGRWRADVLQFVRPARFGPSPHSDHESFVDPLLAILCAGVFGAGGTHNQEDKNPFRTRSTVELPDYVPVLQLFQDVTDKWMGLSIRLFYTGQLGRALSDRLARAEKADRRQQIKLPPNKFVDDRASCSAPDSILSGRAFRSSTLCIVSVHNVTAGVICAGERQDDLAGCGPHEK